MRGSLLVNYNDDIEQGGDYLDIYSNGRLLKRIYNNTNQLYSIPINLGDVITLTYVPLGGFEQYFDLIRKDYTTDDVSGDDGIKTTTLVQGGTVSVYSFTATTISTAYDFEYIFETSVISNYQIWTEDDEPIMTQDDEYINQEY